MVSISLSEKTYRLGQELRISRAIIDRMRNSINSDQQLQEILYAVSQPPSHYYFRINLNKITQEDCIAVAQEQFPEFECSAGEIPNALKINILGPYEIDNPEKRIYVDKFAAESILIGANLFLPGVKKVDAKFNRGEKIALYMLTDQSMEEFTFNETSCHVGNGLSAISSAEFPKFRKGTFVETTEPRYKTPNYRLSTLYEKGQISEHNLPPMIAATAFIDKIWEQNQQESARIADLCAAPGHKTTAMAEWANWRWHQQTQLENPTESPISIKAIDRSNTRLESLRHEMNRLSLFNIEVIATRLEKVLIDHPEFREYFNFVLMDPPCSALGTRPKLYLQHSEEELVNYAKNQTRLIPLADKYLESGGYLMYNTCTMPIEENELMVARFVNELNYKIVDLPANYENFGQHGLGVETLSQSETDKMKRFYPTKTDGIGYFIALLQKQA